MFTVALIGPDGSGKTTVGRRLREQLPIPAQYLYMGVNPQASTHLLPTTRLAQKLRRALGRQRDAGGPREKSRAVENAHKPLPRRILKSVKSSLSLSNRLAEEWYRQMVAWHHLRRRHVVIFDRHFFPDYYAYDIAGEATRSLTQRIHGFVLNHLYPRPDVIIFLDAPAEVLFARKGEGTVELLEQRRGDYLQMQDLVKHFEVVDASRDVDAVVQDVSQRILRFYEAQGGPPR
ncbi:AAA family ATPase [Roseimaritima sediminicola]|uniref:AAA family ATPase n=1 Tax=Roseimaritima sediminicola TaxID=2662066 RepID=UPI0012984710|nr:AAA family ATPase [Roseimaritima sediminicola]